MKRVVPVTADGKEGLVFLLDDTTDLQTWAEAHAEEFVLEGYVRLTVEEYVPTQIVGDKRRKRQ